jgi:hypothetical protein
LVIRYAYLWKAEHQRGQEEGRKDRPCAVILVTADDHGDRIVTALPITHTLPANSGLVVEIPHMTKRRLGLDDERSWILLTEANRFAWPGPDLRPTQPGDLASAAYGLLPRVLFYSKRLPPDWPMLLRHVSFASCLERSERAIRHARACHDLAAAKLTLSPCYFFPYCTAPGAVGKNRI